MNRTQANLLLLVVAMIWGSAFVAQAQVVSIGPFTFTGIRFLLGAMVVAPLALSDFRSLSHRLAWKNLWEVAALGFLLVFGASFQQIGIGKTTVTHAGVLTALYVPLVPLIGWAALRERPHGSVWPAAALCLIGTWLLSGAKWSAIGVGDLWVIAGSVFWALHVILVGRVSSRLPAPFLVSAGQFLVCGAFSLIFAVFVEPITLHDIYQTSGPILYAGVLSVGIAYTGQVVGQCHTGAADAAIILSAETAFAALFGFLFMNERVGLAGMIGCALIFVCILMVQLLPMLSKYRAKEGQSVVSERSIAMNETIKRQLSHRSIREFSGEVVPKELIDTLLQVTNRTATSSGMQQYSIIRVTDAQTRSRISTICRQEYVKRLPEFFIFVADCHRNAQIAAEQGFDGSGLRDMDRFFQAFTDASLAAQNLTNAIESFGMGAVYFGSILNDPQEIIDLLALPKLTFPVLGLGFGYPAQNPQLKPRMDMSLKVFENQYRSLDNYREAIADYDKEMQTYYDLRENGRRSDSFSEQVIKRASAVREKRSLMLAVARKQGFELGV